MKLIGFLSLLVMSTACLGQSKSEQKPKLRIVDEVAVLGNYTVYQHPNLENRFGFGLGLYRSFFDHKRFTLNVGVEYNRTSYFKDRAHISFFSREEDIHVNMDNISIPISTRCQFGKTIVFFIQGGFFLDFLVRGSKKCTSFSYVPDENNQTVFRVQESSGRAGVRPVNFGLSPGLGLKIPIKNLDLMIRSDYRYGLIALRQDYEGKIFNQQVRAVIGISWGRIYQND